MIVTQFQIVGRDLFARGLVSSHAGSLSIRLGDRIIITRRGSMMNCLQDSDLIETGVSRNNRFTPLASPELPVHRSIYKQTQALAIVHAHPPHSTALSIIGSEIAPINTEYQCILGKVPVVGFKPESNVKDLASEIAGALKAQQRIVMVRGHGSFAIGQLLEEAYSFTSVLEESSHVIWLLKSLQYGQAAQSTL